MKRGLILWAAILLLAGAAESADYRPTKLERFLVRYCPTSPLRGKGEEMVLQADRYGLDYRLYLAIAGAESTWGKKAPKKSYNFTGISNGAARFRSINHNIMFTYETIAGKRWYRLYRKTKKLEDLIRVYKAVPPFDKYERSLRFTLDMVTAVKITEPTPALAAKKTDQLLAWNSIRYDKYGIRKIILVN